MNLIAAALRVALVLLLLLWIGVRLLEPRLAFFPVRDIAATPESIGLASEPLVADTGDTGAWALSALAVFGTYRFDQESRMGAVRVPLLIVHGTADEVVPFAHGRRLYEIAGAPKVFVPIPGGGHNDLWARHAAEVWGAAEAFLRNPPSF